MRASLGRLLLPLALLSLVMTAASRDAAGSGSFAAAHARCGLKIAVLGPLTGDSGDLGANIVSGAGLAILQYNERHPDCIAKLVDFDSQGDPKQAPALAQQIVADPQIVGVIGPAFSGESEAADPILDQGGVTTISTSATRTILSQRGWATFHRMVGNDAAQGPAAGRYIHDVLRAQRVFVIDDNSAYGRGLADEVAATLSGKVVQRAAVRPRQTDFTAVVSQVRSAAADVVFYGGYYAAAGSLLRELREARVNAAFVAGDGVKDDGFVRAAGVRAAEGAIITCACLPPEHAGRQFPQIYRSAFGREPGTNSAEAYDAATIFLTGIEAGSTRRADMEAFVDGYAVDGVTGRLGFTSNGELLASSVVVWAYRVHDGNLIVDQEIPRANDH